MFHRSPMCASVANLYLLISLCVCGPLCVITMADSRNGVELDVFVQSVLETIRLKRDPQRLGIDYAVLWTVGRDQYSWVPRVLRGIRLINVEGILTRPSGIDRKHKSSFGNDDLYAGFDEELLLKHLLIISYVHMRDKQEALCLV